jgi:hypothetical protein
MHRNRITRRRRANRARGWLPISMRPFVTSGARLKVAQGFSCDAVNKWLLRFLVRRLQTPVLKTQRGFQSGILRRDFRFQDKIVSKRKVPSDLKGAGEVSMQMKSSRLANWLFAEVPTSSDPIFSAYFVAQLYESLCATINSLKRQCLQENVDNGLRPKTWNGSASDMVKRACGAARRSSNQSRFIFVQSRPRRIVLDYSLHRSTIHSALKLAILATLLRLV